MVKEIEQCRICGNRDLVSVVNLGKQALTGIFPKLGGPQVAKSPLELVKCNENDPSNCGLLQLRHPYDPNLLYGDHYGYRSGLNRSMVDNLKSIVERVTAKVELNPGDVALDIGSNDSTLLQAYTMKDLRLVGIDPGAHKFKKYYPDHIKLIDSFFSASAFKSEFQNDKAKIITSIAMFYDLEAPLDFMKQVGEILADDGIWAFEQSYMPTMIEACAYDTICHEHFEYYRLKQIYWMTEKAGLKIVDVEFNDINGGSFFVVAAKKENSKIDEASVLIKKILAREERGGFASLKLYKTFQKQIGLHRDELRAFFDQAKEQKKKVFGYGASTKGNVVLQYCSITENDISCIAEVNEDKFGCVTPGTNIPIVSEAEARQKAPDYFLVFPWHFRDNIIEREQEYLDGGGKLVFPLPKFNIVSGASYREIKA